MSAAAPTTEELKTEKTEFVKGISSKMFGSGASSVIPDDLDLEPPPAEPAPDPAPEPAPAVPPAEPPKPPQAPPAAPPAAAEPPVPSLAEPPKLFPPTLDSREIESAVERALDKHTPAPPPPPAPVSAVDMLSREDQYTLTVTAKIEQMRPELKGLTDRTMAYLKKEQEWIAEFTKANPGKDPLETEEHEEFQAKNDPGCNEYGEFDFKQAERALWKEEVQVEEEGKRLESERKLTERHKLEKDEPVIARLAYEAVAGCVFDALKDKDGKLPASMEAIIMKDGKVYLDDVACQKLAEEDPVAFRILLEHTEKLHNSVLYLEALDRSPDTPRQRVKLKHSKGSFVPADAVAEDATEFEERMLKLPKDQTTIEGKTLISQEQFFREGNKIQNSKMAEDKKREALRAFDEKYYCLGVAHFRAGLTQLYAERARERINSLNEVVDRKVKRSVPLASPATPEPPATTPTPPAPANDKQHSPAVVSRSEIPDPTKPVVAPKAEDLQNINRTMWGR